MRDKESKRRYDKDYAKRNRARLRDQARARYHADVSKHRGIAKSVYQKDRSAKIEKVLQRRAERRKLVDDILLHYGCRNSHCKWEGDFHPVQLEFHHLDTTTKRKPVAAMTTYSLGVLATEINKCVVLCANCHAWHHHFEPLVLNDQQLCRVTEALEVIV